MRNAPGHVARSWAAALLFAAAALPAAASAQALARPALPVVPDQGVVVAMLTNTGDSMVGSGNGARQVARLFLR